MPKVVEHLPAPELARPRDAGLEGERALEDPTRAALHQDLERDLEPRRPQRHPVDDRPVDGEESAHRVPHGGERAGEERRPRRHEPPKPRETRRPSAGHPAAREDELGEAGPDRLDEIGKGLRRMAPVGVHDDDHLAAGGPDPLDDGRRESRPARPLHEAVEPRGGERLDERAGTVRGPVVHDHDLRVVRAERGHEAGMERRQGRPLVERREDDGDGGRTVHG